MCLLVSSETKKNIHQFGVEASAMSTSPYNLTPLPYVYNHVAPRVHPSCTHTLDESPAESLTVHIAS